MFLNVNLDSHDDLVKEVVLGIVNMSNNLQEELLNNHTEIFERIYFSNPVTAQEVFDKLGFESTIKLFQISSAIQQLLAVADSEYVPLINPFLPDPEQLALGKIVLVENPNYNG